MIYDKPDSDDEEAFHQMREMFGPAQVDSVVRSAIQACWMMLPKEKRNIDELELQFQRLVDRALKNMRDDEEAFG